MKLILKYNFKIHKMKYNFFLFTFKADQMYRSQVMHTLIRKRNLKKPRNIKI